MRLVWYIVTPLVGGTLPSPFSAAGGAILDAAYTAILAPYLFWVLMLLRSPLGIAAQVTPDRR